MSWPQSQASLRLHLHDHHAVSNEVLDAHEPEDWWLWHAGLSKWDQNADHVHAGASPARPKTSARKRARRR